MSSIIFILDLEDFIIEQINSYCGQVYIPTRYIGRKYSDFCQENSFQSVVPKNFTSSVKFNIETTIAEHIFNFTLNELEMNKLLVTGHKVQRPQAIRCIDRINAITGYKIDGSIPLEDAVDKLIFFYDSLLFNMPTNVYWLDKKCKMLGCNKNVLDFLKMNSINDFVGKTYSELAALADWEDGLAEQFKADDMYVIETGEPIISKQDPPVKLPNGEIGCHVTDRVPLRDAGGNITGVVGISHNVTELKKTQKNLEKALALAEQSEEKRKEFLKNQEHDINTAISGIEYASVIMEDSDDLDAIHYVAKEITVCAKRLKNYNKTLIKDLAWLDGEGKVVEQRMSIRDVCSNLYGLNNLSAKNKGISFIVNVADEIPDYFMGDEMILFQSLQNIVANAIQFTEEGTIELAVNIVEQCYKNDDCMLLAFHVKDTGRGIDAKHQRYIFDDFFKVVPSNEPDLISGVQADQDKGRGLGLTLSRKYIETMGGELHLHKSELEVGSEFVATLPLKVALNQQKPS